MAAAGSAARTTCILLHNSTRGQQQQQQQQQPPSINAHGVVDCTTAADCAGVAGTSTRHLHCVQRGVGLPTPGCRQPEVGPLCMSATQLPVPAAEGFHTVSPRHGCRPRVTAHAGDLMLRLLPATPQGAAHAMASSPATNQHACHPQPCRCRKQALAQLHPPTTQQHRCTADSRLGTGKRIGRIARMRFQVQPRGGSLAREPK